jgi:hypothetical protein
MKNGNGAKKMRVAMRKLAKIIAAGLEYSARTTALHESLPWDGNSRRLREDRCSKP